ncbi:MAG: hypothetical protein AAF960_11270 [Bacteroidota bacterium]
MAFFQAYTTGLQTIFTKGKLWLLLYALNFLFAVLLAYPLSSFLGDKLVNTMAVDVLLERFDFTVFIDFFNEYGDVFGWLLNQSVAAILLYLLLNVFLVGGILTVFVRPQRTSVTNFWSGGAHFFWRMLRLTIYFLLFQGVLLGIFLTIVSSIFSNWPEGFDNEEQIVQRLFIIIPVYLLLSTVLFMVQDYAKIRLVNSNKSLVTLPILRAFRWTFRHFGQAFLLYLLNLLTFGVLFFIYLQMHFDSAVLATFLVGQFFVIARIGTKLLNLASASELYTQSQLPKV